MSHILQQDCQLDVTRPVLIGVSGGPDSICLLDLMWRIGYSLVVAHLNHGLRSEAEGEAAAVGEAAQDRALPFVMKKVDIRTYSRQHTLSVEEASRKVRYEFLFEQAHQCQAQAVAVAHTADDQVETILMHLLRGAGLSGLKGMNYRIQPNPWSKEIALIRPLLGVFREDVLAYCIEFGLQPSFDRSNLDTTFFRNRIRKDLIPYLETYNLKIKSTLIRMSQTLTNDDQVLEILIRDVWQECCLAQGSASVTLHIGKLAVHPVGVQRRIVRQAISILRPGLRDIDFATIEKALSFLQLSTQNAQWDLADGLRVLREGEKLWIANWESNLSTEDWPQYIKPPQQLPVPGRIDLLNGWYIQAEPVVDINDAVIRAGHNTDLFQAWIDAGQDQLVIIRTPLPGDRFLPLGMAGHSTKLSDFFVNVKLPRRARRCWPLVCLDNRIAWIPGYRLAHPNRLTSMTSQMIYLRLLKN